MDRRMIAILDGGIGQELVARTGSATPLWAILSLIETPEIIRAVHDNYFSVGADIATTNTYAVLPDRLQKHGIADQLVVMQQRACQLAVDARDAHGSGIVAGALGPLGFSYQIDALPPTDQAAEIYANIVALQAPYVDVHLLETMCSIEQARGALLGASRSSLPTWIAFSVDDQDGSKLRSGEPLVDVLPLLKAFAPAAVLINCSLPEAISTAVSILSTQSIPVGAYANRFAGIAESFSQVGATVDLLEVRKDLGPTQYADAAARWVSDGASIIGGCCDIGPAYIQELVRRFKR